VSKLITAKNCQEIYRLLIKLPPLSGWRLPSPDQVNFKVRHLFDVYGTYEPNPHLITISSAKHLWLETVQRTIVHECIHLKLFLKHGENGPWDKHTPEFLTLANDVATKLGFDPKEL
jgi:hypothetical protein